MTDLGSRIFMVALNYFGVAAIITVIMAIMLSSFRDAARGNSFNVLLMFTFAAAFLATSLTMVKISIPVEWVLCRNKSAEAQRRTIEALVCGKSDTAAASEPSPAFDSEPEAAPHNRCIVCHSSLLARGGALAHPRARRCFVCGQCQP